MYLLAKVIIPGQGAFWLVEGFTNCFVYRLLYFTVIVTTILRKILEKGLPGKGFCELKYKFPGLPLGPGETKSK